MVIVICCNKRPLDSRTMGLRVRDLTREVFFAYSQIIDTPESFIALLFHQNQKINTVILTKGALSDLTAAEQNL